MIYQTYEGYDEANNSYKIKIAIVKDLDKISVLVSLEKNKLEQQKQWMKQQIKVREKLLYQVSKQNQESLRNILSFFRFLQSEWLVKLSKRNNLRIYSQNFMRPGYISYNFSLGIKYIFEGQFEMKEQLVQIQTIALDLVRTFDDVFEIKIQSQISSLMIDKRCLMLLLYNLFWIARVFKRQHQSKKRSLMNLNVQEQADKYVVISLSCDELLIPPAISKIMQSNWPKSKNQQFTKLKKRPLNYRLMKKIKQVMDSLENGSQNSLIALALVVSQQILTEIGPYNQFFLYDIEEDGESHSFVTFYINKVSFDTSFELLQICSRRNSQENLV